MLDESGNYHGTKRAVLAFSVLSLFLCSSGSDLSEFSFLGISVTGLGVQLLKFAAFAGALYYASLYGLSAYLEAKTAIIPLDSETKDLRELLQESLGRLDRAEERLEPLLDQANHNFQKSTYSSLVSDLQELMDRREIRVGPNFTKAAFVRPDNEVPDFFNFVSATMNAIKNRVPGSGQLGLDELRMDAAKHLEIDLKKLFEKLTRENLQSYWQNFESKAANAEIQLSQFHADYSRDVGAYRDSLSELREPLNQTLLQVMRIRSIRTFRFWILEVAAVVLLVVAAVAHYVGEFYPIIPTPLG